MTAELIEALKPGLIQAAELAGEAAPIIALLAFMAVFTRLSGRIF